MSQAVEKTSTLTNIDWFFFTILASENCPAKDLKSLQYDYSLPELLKLKEYVEIADDFNKASYRDMELKNKSK